MSSAEISISSSLFKEKYDEYGDYHSFRVKCTGRNGLKNLFIVNVSRIGSIKQQFQKGMSTLYASGRPIKVGIKVVSTTVYNMYITSSKKPFVSSGM